MTAVSTTATLVAHFLLGHACYCPRLELSIDKNLYDPHLFGMDRPLTTVTRNSNSAKSGGHVA